MRELLIVGIDPGTTVGYAVLDIRGNVLRTRSSKLLELNSLVEEITEIGSVLAVGTDKGKAPALVEKFAAKTGAKVIAPGEDLPVIEKDATVAASGHNALNAHEKDALAAALYAYKELEPLLRRIEKVLKEQSKPGLFNEVTGMVLLEGMNIRDSILAVEDQMREPITKKESSPIIAVAAEKTAREATLELQLKQLQRENEILKQYNSRLLSRMKEINRELRRVSKKNRQTPIPSKAHRDETAKKLQEIIYAREKLIAGLKDDSAALTEIIRSAGSGRIAARKVNVLGIDAAKGGKENDIIIVDNVKSFSEKALEQLKNKNVTVISNESFTPKTSAVFREKGITLIPATGIIILESEGFASVDRQKLEDAKEKFRGKDIRGIIESYKEERKYQLMQHDE